MYKSIVHAIKVTIKTNKFKLNQPSTNLVSIFFFSIQDAYHQAVQNHHHTSLQSTAMTQQLMQQASENSAKKASSQKRNPVSFLC